MRIETKKSLDVNKAKLHVTLQKFLVSSSIVWRIILRELELYMVWR